MLIDSHAHLHDKRFKQDQEKVIQNLYNDGIELVINSGGGTQSNMDCIKVAEKYNNIYATVGINCGGEAEFNEIPKIYGLLKHPKVIAIGEIGLDYHHYPDEKEIQKKCFIEQLKIAQEVDLPIVVHDRKANLDTYKIIKQSKIENPNLRGVLHCYSGDLALAKEYIKLGFYLSIAGPVTYRSASQLKEVAKYIPLRHLFIETDSPYLPPAQIGKGRNEPQFVSYVAETIAQLKGISFGEVAQVTTENVKNLYQIK